MLGQCGTHYEQEVLHNGGCASTDSGCGDSYPPPCCYTTSKIIFTVLLVAISLEDDTIIIISIPLSPKHGSFDVINANIATKIYIPQKEGKHNPGIIRSNCNVQHSDRRFISYCNIDHWMKHWALIFTLIMRIKTKISIKTVFPYHCFIFPVILFLFGSLWSI